jgi:tripartite-type tricarboxylate transporter receptor subunit TctC
MARRVLWISVFALICASFVMEADIVEAKYPERNIEFIVAWEPGGGVDIVARALTQYVNPYLGGKLFVKNVPGSGGAIGFREAAKAASNGYSIMMMSTSIMVGPHVIKGHLPYDALDPLCVVAQDPSTLMVRPDSPISSVQDLIAKAKANPGKLSACTFGVGSISHLELAAFEKATGTSFNMVPYKGTAPQLTAAMGGHVDLSANEASTALNYVRGNKLRPLVVFGNKRSPLYPDVPTGKELGIDVVIYQWRAVGVPKGMPKEIRDTLADAFRKAVENEECKKTFDQIGLERIYLPMEEAVPWLKGQNDLISSIAHRVGLEPK